MELDHEPKGGHLFIRARGKLDATWADYFAEVLLAHVRNGHHHLVVDVGGVPFLSSAGIRALLQVYKAVQGVEGGFRLVHPTPFVEQVLKTAGFQQLLGVLPADMPGEESSRGEETEKERGLDHFLLEVGARLALVTAGGWRPWQKVDPGRLTSMTFRQDLCALGIGSPASDFEFARGHFGEFLAVSGNLVYQPPDEQGRTDYLVSEGRYLPAVECIQLLCFAGDMGHLLRFAPTDETPYHTVSQLLGHVLERAGDGAAGFVILGEIEGLVGTALIRSPGLLEEERTILFPEIRDWLSFCGERSHSHRQALMTGVACYTSACGASGLLSPLPSRPDISAHVHAAVFPYQPLQNGRIDLGPAILKFFQGAPPLAMMHLVEDSRPAVGLGESALIRGACWFGPLENAEAVL